MNLLQASPRLTVSGGVESRKAYCVHHILMHVCVQIGMLCVRMGYAYYVHRVYLSMYAVTRYGRKPIHLVPLPGNVALLSSLSWTSSIRCNICNFGFLLSHREMTPFS